MNNLVIDTYLKHMRVEIDELIKAKYNGSVELRINLKQGTIINMNIITNKSMWCPSPIMEGDSNGMQSKKS